MKFNTASDNVNPWSLIARLRSDSDVISDNADRNLKRFSCEIANYMTDAMSMAIRRQEVAATTPIEDIGVQLVSITISTGPITQDSGNFERLEELYRAFENTVRAAYGIVPKATRRSPSRD